jgi:pimeloyl-ACP methyl ester carboxylesterase
VLLVVVVAHGGFVPGVPADYTRAVDVTTPDGRRLAVTETGDPNGAPVIGHHGTPGSGAFVPPLLEELAREQGVRLVLYDRPGYGASTRHEGRTVVDCVADVHAIADALALERFASWGISGGGPHVLACAARCDERLVAVASLASVAPYEAEGLDWLAGMGEGNVQEFDAVLGGPETLAPFLEKERAELIAAEPEELAAALRTLLGPEDLEVLTVDHARNGVAEIRTGLAPGYDGWLDDDLAHCAPWGFDLSEIGRPVLLVHGEGDRFVPVAHAHWLAAHIPGVEARILAGDGHLTMLVRRVREAHEWLLARL